MLRTLAAAAAALAMTGCATVVNDSMQPMKVETAKADGTLVSGAECKLTNDYGTVTSKSGDTVQIRRSGKDLDITKENDKVVIRFAYNKELELIAPVYLLIKYEGRSR